MKILIIGSLYFCVDVNLKDRVIAACRELGTEIARKGHTIIVGSDNAKTVDLYVVQGANRVPKKQKLIVHLPERDDAGENRRIAPFSHQRAEFPNITEISYRASKGPWSVGRTYAIREADVVIVIGGARGAAQVGYSASALNKPVLAIPYFGGSAVEIWDTVSPYYSRCGISEDEEAALRLNWDHTSAAVAVTAAEKLVKRNPWRSEGPRTQILFLAGVVALLAVWVGVFLRLSRLPNNLAFFVLLGDSAFLGTGMRNALRVTTDVTTQYSPRVLLNEATAGLLIAFGLSLTYLAGGIVFTGHFVSLDADPDFTRIGVTMSLLGLAAGFSFESAAEKVRKWLEAELSKRT